jgi:hypothetical protein
MADLFQVAGSETLTACQETTFPFRCGARTLACRVDTRVDALSPRAQVSRRVPTRHARVRAPRVTESMWNVYFVTGSYEVEIVDYH